MLLENLKNVVQFITRIILLKTILGRVESNCSASSTVTVIKEELYDALYDALATLSVDDQLLLYKLYAKNSSLRGAMQNNLNHPTKVKRHKEALLKKLAILLKEYEEDFFDSITR